MAQSNKKINTPFQFTVLSPQEKIDWLRLARTELIGPKTFFETLKKYYNPTQALEALPDLLSKKYPKKNLKIPSIQDIQQELEQHDKLKADLIAFVEPEYPEILRHIADPPPVISVLGNRHLLQKHALAIVGARNASLNGKKFAEKLARELGDYGYQIISGLARGIDTSVHVGSLSSGTIAVLAGGIDHIYPYENTDLYYKIAEQGLIIAESPFGTIPQASFFPRRNRIISGLSLGVIIIEAAKQSGSLVTARFALEQGREVFAVPGSPMDPRSYGTNKLIREGATLIQNSDDVLSSVESFIKIQPPLQGQKENPYSQEISLLNNKNDEQTHHILLNLLSSSPIGVDQIIRECHFSMSEVMLALLELELAGRIQRYPGGQVSLKG